MDRTQSSQDDSLKRNIGFVALLFTAVTGIIGSGWLFASMYAAQIAGPAAIFSWLIGGTVAIILALVYAELGGMLPVAGALARIPYFTHGMLSGFTAGWLCWIAYVTTAPIEVTAVLDYSSNYLPWLTINQHGERVLSSLGLLVAALLMFIFTVINMLGVKWLARANTAITFWKLVIPVMAPLILVFAGFRFENFFNMGGFSPNGIAGVFGAVSSGGVMFCLFGFRTAIDMAGESKNPQRDVPLAMIGAVLICLVIYILLQVAFIGAIPPEHLKQGWHKITETAPGGPFAAFATLLGLSWLALLLYVDAIVSPSGTALAYTGATARINYAMAQSDQFPKVFEKLNRFKVPVWALLFNFLVGMIIFLPFPGWSELVSFISSAIILSFAFGPVSLAALRYQIPDKERPFRVPFGIIFSAISFVLVGFVVYWTGWATNWKVFLAAFIGFGFLILARSAGRSNSGSLHFRQSVWVFLYIAGMAVISYLGTFGHGRGLLPKGFDLALISVFSLVIFRLAIGQRLSDSDTKNLINSKL